MYGFVKTQFYSWADHHAWSNSKISISLCSQDILLMLPSFKYKCFQVWLIKGILWTNIHAETIVHRLAKVFYSCCSIHSGAVWLSTSAKKHAREQSSRSRDSLQTTCCTGESVTENGKKWIEILVELKLQLQSCSCESYFFLWEFCTYFLCVPQYLCEVCVHEEWAHSITKNDHYKN